MSAVTQGLEVTVRGCFKQEDIDGWKAEGFDAYGCQQNYCNSATSLFGQPLVLASSFFVFAYVFAQM